MRTAFSEIHSYLSKVRSICRLTRMNSTQVVQWKVMEKNSSHMKQKDMPEKYNITAVQDCSKRL
jgi:hypothetical protein